MKARKEHRIPLTESNIALLQPVYENQISNYIFPSVKRHNPLSNMAMESVLRRMKIENATVHGFRSSFRDWAGDKTSFPREIAEQALAHSVGSNVELAYRRGDAFEKRRKLMSAWSDYLSQNNNLNSEKVVKLHG